MGVAMVMGTVMLIGVVILVGVVLVVGVFMVVGVVMIVGVVVGVVMVEGVVMVVGVVMIVGVVMGVVMVEGVVMVVGVVMAVGVGRPRRRAWLWSEYSTRPGICSTTVSAPSSTQRPSFTRWRSTTMYWLLYVPGGRPFGHSLVLNMLPWQHAGMTS